MVIPVMEERETYQASMEARLGRLGARIDEFQAEAEKLGGKAKADFYKRIEELHMKQATVRQRFQEMKDTGGDIWMELKTGLEKSYLDLKETLDKVSSKIAQFPYVNNLKTAGKAGGLLLGGMVAGYFIGKFIHRTK